MLPLKIQLFGQLSVSGDISFPDLIPGKAKELLCYLLIHRQRPLGREFLASTLWTDCSTGNSKQYLRKALWQLQRVLPEFGACGESILEVNSQWIAINPKAAIWVDVEQFESLSVSDQNPSLCADGSRKEALEAAANLYRGDLLEGWYHEWCLRYRERLRHMYLTVLDRIVISSEANREYEKGLDYAARILRCDRAHESAHQHLMRLRYLSGDRAGALRQYENCATALKEELGVQPSEQTRQLYRQICDDHTPQVNSLARNHRPGPQSGPSALGRALNRLLEVKATLGALQSTIDESLSHVRQMLQGSDDSGGSG